VSRSVSAVGQARALETTATATREAWSEHPEGSLYVSEQVASEMGMEGSLAGPAEKSESGKSFLKRRKAKTKVSHKLKWDAKPRTVCKLETRYIPAKQKSRGKSKTKAACSSKLDFSKVRSKVDSRWKPEPDDDESDEAANVMPKRPMTSGVPQEITGDKSSFFISVSDYRKAMDVVPNRSGSSGEHTAEGDAASSWMHSNAINDIGTAQGCGDVQSGNYKNALVDSRNKVHESENRRLGEMDDALVDIEQTVELLIVSRGNFHLFEPPRQTRIPYVSKPEGLHKALENEHFRTGLKALSQS